MLIKPSGGTLSIEWSPWHHHEPLCLAPVLAPFFLSLWEDFTLVHLAIQQDQWILQRYVHLSLIYSYEKNLIVQKQSIC